ncbi:MAG: hypothetical protein IJ916_07830 [Paludibacteraceae bacterium]|nr:hypothetical protein [Paludibacteraceae bacterium]
MKKVLFNILLCFGSLFSCFAQPEHRISLGFGLFSYAYIDEFIWEHTDVDYWYPGVDDYGTYEYTEEKLQSLPVNLNLHYECTLGKHFGIGLCLGYDRIRMRQETEYVTTVGEEVSPRGYRYPVRDTRYEYGRLYRHVLSVMPEATVYWFKRQHVAMYSKLAAGVRFNIEKRVISTMNTEDTRLADRHFYCQVSPVCVEVGGQYWRGFVEGGFGAQGVIQYGVKHTFKGKKEQSNED